MSTQFACIRTGRNVRVGESKVCGRRISNRATRRGWSNSVHTGKDNACRSRLHKFATDEDAEKAGACWGNTNWLNPRMPVFGKVPQTTYETRGGITKQPRPMFLEDTTTAKSKPVSIPVNKRTEVAGIERRAFESPAISGRTVDFDKLVADDIKAHGIKVQFGEKTIKATAEDTKRLDDNFKKLQKAVRDANLSSAEDRGEFFKILEKIEEGAREASAKGETLSKAQIDLLQRSVDLLQGTEEVKEEAAVLKAPAKLVWTGSELRDNPQAMRTVTTWLEDSENIDRFNKATGRTGDNRLTKAKPALGGRRGETLVKWPRRGVNYTFDIDTRTFTPLEVSSV